MTRCIDMPGTDVWFNLAAEEYLLKQTRDDCFLLWQAEPSVVVGRFQSVRAETDAALARERHIALARRYSGGGAVYHDRGNFNITFIETTDKPTFAHYLHSVTEFLHTLGISAGIDHRLGIYVDGRKVSGSAQSVYKDRVLYHCTLLLDTDLNTLQAVLRGEEGANPGAVPSVHSPVANLKSFLSDEYGMEHFREEVFLYFLNRNPENRRDTLSESEQEAIGRLRAEKYATEEWIYNRL